MTVLAERMPCASPIHNWDAACRMVAMVSLIFATAFAQSLSMALVSMLLALVGHALAGLSWISLFRGLRWLLLALLPLFLLIPLDVRYSFETGLGSAWRWDGAHQASVISLRALAIWAYFSLLRQTSNQPQSMRALHELHLPRVFIQLLLFTSHYATIYMDQLHRMRLSLKSRGFKAGLNSHSLHVIASQVGMLLVGSFEQSERVYLAMKSRGYNGEYPFQEGPGRAGADWFKMELAMILALLILFGDLKCRT